MASIKAIILCITALSMITSCASDVTTLSDIPIVVHQFESQTVDIDLLITNAHNEVEKILPGSSLTFFSLVAECEDLSELQGEINLFFSQARQTHFGERVFTARVVIDTIQQKLRMEVQDETEQYLSTELLELKAISTAKMANALESYLASQNKCGGTVVLARGDTDGPWGVRCGPPDKVFIECIEIDSLSGKIKQLR